ncbi:MAG: DUF3471 domain-containing protein [Acidobacteria bacterium]|nr:DUF3471 domain-containing protein [Acidobacteriota bacterium]
MAPSLNKDRVVRLAALAAIAFALCLPAVARAQAIHVDPLLLERYVGQYALSEHYVLTILVDRDRLYVRAPTRGQRLLIPRSETEFIEVESGLRIRFGIRPDTREVDHLIFEQQGIGRRADRITSEVGLDPATRPAAALPEATLDRYVGHYEEQPGFAITITREGDHLLAQLTDQEAVAIFPESETDFFYRDSNARISFRVTGGQIEALVLHQGGSALEMRRMD